jgi:hypothetical protein
MAWLFASVVLILLVVVPGWGRKLAVAIVAIVIAFLVAGCASSAPGVASYFDLIPNAHICCGLSMQGHLNKAEG